MAAPGDATARASCRRAGGQAGGRASNALGRRGPPWLDAWCMRSRRRKKEERRLWNSWFPTKALRTGGRASLLSGRLLKIAGALMIEVLLECQMPEQERGPDARHAARHCLPLTCCCAINAPPPHAQRVSCSPVSCASTNACPPAPPTPLHSYQAQPGSTSIHQFAPAPRLLFPPCSRPRPSTAAPPPPQP